MRYEVHKRFSIFYFIGEMASAFGSMLALGLMQMKGLGGLNGWRWIFIIGGHDPQASNPSVPRPPV